MKDVKKDEKLKRLKNIDLIGLESYQVIQNSRILYSWLVMKVLYNNGVSTLKVPTKRDWCIDVIDEGMDPTCLKNLVVVIWLTPMVNTWSYLFQVQSYSCTSRK